MPEHKLFGKQSRSVSPTERIVGVKSSVVIFFFPINVSAYSRWLGSTQSQNYSLHPLAVKKLEGKVGVLKDEKKTAERH